MVWVGRDLKDYLVPAPLPGARIPSTRSGCSKETRKELKYLYSTHSGTEIRSSTDLCHKFYKEVFIKWICNNNKKLSFQ